jgi:hypothetical protein
MQVSEGTSMTACIRVAAVHLLLQLWLQNGSEKKTARKKA